MTDNPGAIEQIVRLFLAEGTSDYLGEQVTQAEHMLRAGWLAMQAGAGESLVAAALLHDVGHFKGTLKGSDLMTGRDNRHSHAGADWLAQWFGVAVCEPVRWHVEAKRYLCALEPSYASRLSSASAFTLAVQGGPLSAEQVAEFEEHSFAADAVALRRFDDNAKDPGVQTPSLETFLPILESLITNR